MDTQKTFLEFDTNSLAAIKNAKQQLYYHSLYSEDDIDTIRFFITLHQSDFQFIVSTYKDKDTKYESSINIDKCEFKIYEKIHGVENVLIFNGTLRELNKYFRFMNDETKETYYKFIREKIKDLKVEIEYNQYYIDDIKWLLPDGGESIE